MKPKKGNSLQAISVIYLSIAFLLAGSAVADSEIEDFTTSEGKSYTRVKVVKVDPSGIKIYHSSGVVIIPYEELPLHLQAKWNFDKASAAKFREERGRLEEQARVDRRNQKEIDTLVNKELRLLAELEKKKIQLVVTRATDYLDGRYRCDISRPATRVVSYRAKSTLGSDLGTRKKVVRSKSKHMDCWFYGVLRRPPSQELWYSRIAVKGWQLGRLADGTSVFTSDKERALKFFRVHGIASEQKVVARPKYTR